MNIFDDQTIKLSVLCARAEKARGKIIDNALFLEKIIDDWISMYFSQNQTRQIEFFELILHNERFTYASKIQVFDYIVKKHCPDFVRHYPKVSGELADIGTLRNKLAHWILDISDEALSADDFTLLKMKNRKGESETITSKDIYNMVQMIEKYRIAVTELETPPLDSL